MHTNTGIACSPSCVEAESLNHRITGRGRDVKAGIGGGLVVGLRGPPNEASTLWCACGGLSWVISGVVN